MADDDVDLNLEAIFGADDDDEPAVEVAASQEQAASSSHARAPADDAAMDDLDEEMADLLQPAPEAAPREKREKKAKDGKDKGKKDKDKKAKRDKSDRGADAAAAAAAAAPAPAPAIPEAVKEKKARKEGKEKKAGKDKKEKKHSKDKERASSAAAAETGAPVIPEPVKLGKSKDKKDKKEKKLKKADKEGKLKSREPLLPLAGGASQAAAPADEAAAKAARKAAKKAAKLAAAAGGAPLLPEDSKKDKKLKKLGKEGKEKKDKKDKKDKKEKKDGLKRIAAEAGLPEAPVAPEDEDDMLGDIFGEADLAGPADAGGSFTDMLTEFDPTQPGEAPEDRKDNAEIFDSIFGDTDGAAPLADRQAEGYQEKPKPIKLLHPPKPRPKRKKTSQEEAEKDDWPEQLGLRFLKVLDYIKMKRPLAIKEDEGMKFVQDVIQEMFDVAKADDELLSAGQPATKKLQMLPKVTAVMSKYQFAWHFVTFDGCKALAAWLKFLPDGSLPNVHMRTQLLQGMTRLPILKEQLKESSLGRIVKEMSLHPKETIENRKVAGELVQKWLKQVLGASDGAGDEVVEKVPKLQRPPAETAETLAVIEAESAKRIHPAVPVIEGKEYAIKPVARDQPIKRDKVSENSIQGKVAACLKNLSRPNKRAWKPYDVDIAGRAVNAI